MALPDVILSEAAAAASESKDSYAVSHQRAFGFILVARLSLVLGVLIALPAFSQTADPFASLHAQVSAAADAALVQPFLPAVVVSEPAPQNAQPVAAPPQGAVERKGAYSLSEPSGAARLRPLRPAIYPILREHGVPPEFAAVVLVESGGNPAALSPKGARGLWQIMPDTARRYGLVVSSARDDRLDLVKSTQAAASYLRDLFLQFGSWPLALAAYNAGEQVVQRAAERTGSRDFIGLSRALPLETRSYVPAVLAAASTVSRKPVATPAIRQVVYAGME